MTYGWFSISGAGVVHRTLLVLGTKGIATRNKDATGAFSRARSEVTLDANDAVT